MAQALPPFPAFNLLIVNSRFYIDKNALNYIVSWTFWKKSKLLSVGAMMIETGIWGFFEALRVEAVVAKIGVISSGMRNECLFFSPANSDSGEY